MQCQSCSRLVDYLNQVKQEYPDYHCQPVPAYGPTDSQLMIVGLAPGKHGANASGIPFTGDASGTMLFKQLKTFGFASSFNFEIDPPVPRLQNCRITNAVKCLPPGNKPLSEEINHCNVYLSEELVQLPNTSVLLALGHLAHRAILKALSLKQTEFKFSHGAMHHLPAGFHLVDSYHCSRYNFQTGRLTEMMFNDIFHTIKRLIDDS